MDANLTGVYCDIALLPEGWAHRVSIEFNTQGNISRVQTNTQPGSLTRLAGPVIPGMPNLHSHAFQRAMAGLTQRVGPSDDSFWTWRSTMYSFVANLQPDAVQAIAAQLYVDMLKNGYTAVGEFHYLHHNPDGSPYTHRAELSHRIIAAALETGIGITHLPVLYAQGGFGEQPASAAQRRFLNDGDGFAEILEDLINSYRHKPGVRIGIAPHSLRAVPPALLNTAIEHLDRLDDTAPIHIHIAEQEQEVADCVAWSGLRPVQWLLERQTVNARWCLIHATHMTETETSALAASGAVAGLCPTTEADLGDGLFPALEFLARGGSFGIGSDSHASVSPFEELRLLEYGQRLTRRRRNLLRCGASGSIGAGLYREALAGGALALGYAGGRIATGYRADLIELDCEQPLLFGKENDILLDSCVFSGTRELIREVIVGGRHVVHKGRHWQEDAVAERYRRALSALAMFGVR